MVGDETVLVRQKDALEGVDHVLIAVDVVGVARRSWSRRRRWHRWVVVVDLSLDHVDD